MCGPIGNWVRRAAAIIPVLSLVLLAPSVVHADADMDPVAAMIARVTPAVVRVNTIRPPSNDDDKAGAQVAKTAEIDPALVRASGSGYIIDPAGYIGTNKHVIDGAIAVFVVTADGTHYPAKVVGMPEAADIALLRIDAGRPLPFIHFGDSDKVRVGDPVIAIGSPFGFDSTVTSGIISALNRDIMESPFDDYLQTDAAINHGNSGGPLFNMAGEVIGMNSIIFAPTQGFAGLAFAIPSNGLKFIYDRLMKTGEINIGMLPIHTQEVTWQLQQSLGAPDLSGALVTSVQDDSGTMLQGKIRPGDVIRTFGGEKVWDPRDLARKAAMAPIGSDVFVEIYRAGETETAHVTIQAWPDAKPPVLDYDGPKTLGLELASTTGKNGQPVVTVTSVAHGTAADSRLQKGDIILQVQQTAVSQPDQALSLFKAQSKMKHRFAAVLVERDKKVMWMPVLVPE